jgi:hypothetical protein
MLFVRYGDLALDDLNAAIMLHAPGVMAEGNWSVAASVDHRAYLQWIKDTVGTP